MRLGLNRFQGFLGIAYFLRDNRMAFQSVVLHILSKADAFDTGHAMIHDSWIRIKPLGKKSQESGVK